MKQLLLHFFFLINPEEVVLTLTLFLLLAFTGNPVEHNWAGTHTLSVDQNHSPSIVAGQALSGAVFIDIIFNCSF